jgi:hypothetical protein
LTKVQPGAIAQLWGRWLLRESSYLNSEIRPRSSSRPPGVTKERTRPALAGDLSFPTFRPETPISTLRFPVILIRNSGFHFTCATRNDIRAAVSIVFTDLLGE